MGPGAPDVSAAGLLILLLAFLFVLFASLYWNAFISMKALATLPFLIRHAAGAVAGVLTASLACFIAFVGIIHGTNYFGVYIPIIVVFIVFSYINYLVRRRFKLHVPSPRRAA